MIPSIIFQNYNTNWESVKISQTSKRVNKTHGLGNHWQRPFVVLRAISTTSWEHIYDITLACRDQLSPLIPLSGSPKPFITVPRNPFMTSPLPVEGTLSSFVTAPSFAKQICCSTCWQFPDLRRTHNYCIHIDVDIICVFQVKSANLPLIIDADGLWYLINNPSVITNYPQAILTPNAMEFSRLANVVLNNR